MSKSKVKQQRSASPTLDIEYHPASKNKPAQEVADSLSQQEVQDTLIFKIRQASSQFSKEHGRPATNADIAEMIDEDESRVKNMRDSLKLARQGKRLNELRTSALKVGFSRRKDASEAELKGLDLEQSLLTPSDIQRLARAHPLSFENGSYSEQEVKMRLKLMNETLPVGSARQIIAAIEPFFRDVITKATWATARRNSQRITPSVMLDALKPYNGLPVFTSCAPPEGLIRHAKQVGINVYDRREKDIRELMSVTAEDKSAWKKKDSEGKRCSAFFNAEMAEHEKQKKKNAMSDKGKKRSGSKFISDQAEVDDDDEEQEDESESAPAPVEPKKKKSKAK